MMRARLVSRIARLIREDSAAAMVEFAIVVSLLLVIVFGTVDYSRYFLSRTNLTNAARDAARYGALQSTCGSTDTVKTHQHAREHITDFPVGYKDSGTVTVTCPIIAADTLYQVQISNYPFKPATFLVIKAAKRISVTSAFRRELQ